MRHVIGSARLGGVVMATLLVPGVFAQQPAQSAAGPGATQIVDGVQIEGDVPPPKPAWGVTALSSVTYTFAAFNPIDSTTTIGYAVLGNPSQLCRYRTAGSTFVEAPINLPNGALIESAEFTLCDSNATAGIDSWLVVNARDWPIAGLSLVSTTVVEAPGCVNRSFVLGVPVQVDNANNAYSLEVALGATDSSTAICQARVNYRLQASPAPAFATFADVPTSSPFHRFVEALVASGVTGGCAPGLYCPDAPVTRAQMAVFLSVALGLHFPG